MKQTRYYENVVSQDSKLENANQALVAFKRGSTIIRSTWVNGTARPFDTANGIKKSFGRETLSFQ